MVSIESESKSLTEKSKQLNTTQASEEKKLSVNGDQIITSESISESAQNDEVAKKKLKEEKGSKEAELKKGTGIPIVYFEPEAIGSVDKVQKKIGRSDSEDIKEAEAAEEELAKSISQRNYYELEAKLRSFSIRKISNESLKYVLYFYSVTELSK